MRITALASTVIVLQMGAHTAEITTHLDVDGPEIVAAMKTAWAQSLAGMTGFEATFRLDGNPSDYEVVVLPYTNEYMKQKIEIIPGRTFAVFHVHPCKAEPAPSGQDKKLAHKYGLKIVTIHLRGLYEYDPVTRKTTKLRNGIDWINPVERAYAAGSPSQYARSVSQAVGR